jgi:hypothetical protein
MDPRTVSHLKSCKEAEFPLCLERALTSMFSDKRLIETIAARAGFKSQKVTTIQDLWEIYVNFLICLNQELGKDVGAVIESKTLEEIEIMKCTHCPMYDFGKERKKRKYSEPLPSV